MWVFTTNGFLSVVRDKNDSKLLVVRARRKEHLRAFLDGCGLTEVQAVHYPEADYAYRAWVSPGTFAEWLGRQAKAIEYTNFKDACADAGAGRPYLECLMAVWRVCYRMTGMKRFIADDADVRIVPAPPERKPKKGGRRA